VLRRVVCPYAANEEREHPGLYPETSLALARLSPVVVEYVDVSRHERAYFELLDRLWSDCLYGREDLCLIEHDIVVHEDVFPEFEECSEPWCAFPYAMTNVVQPGLGCTRFRHELIAAIPDAWGRVARHGNDRDVPDGMPSKHWLRCDVRLDAELMPLGYFPHVHDPQVEHLNPRQQLVGA
jgi:hypothetical protein